MRETKERLFQALIESSSDILMTLDASGIVLYVSPSVTRVLGYEPEELVGKIAFQDIHPDDLPKCLHVLAANIQSPPEHPTTDEYLYRHKDGSWRTLETTCQVVADNSELSGVVVVCRDVTGRKRRQQELQESEAKYRTLVERLTEGIMIIRADRLEVLFANPAMEAMLGYTLKALYSLSPDDLANLVHHEDRSTTLERIVARREGKPLAEPHEFRIVRTDGTVAYLSASSRRINYEGHEAMLLSSETLRSRGESRRNCEKASQGSGRSWRMRPTPSSSTMTPAPLWMGAKDEDLTGYRREELVGKAFAESRLFAEGDLPRALSNMQDLLRGKRLGPTEYGLITKRGSHVSVEITGFPISRNGKIEVVAIARDITERKRADEALQKSEQLFRTIVENSSDFIRIIEPNGIIRYDSPSTRESSAMSQESFLAPTALISSIRKTCQG